MGTVLLIIAIIFFVLEAFKVSIPAIPITLGWLGLAFFAASFLV